jgi:hypothetical protein
MPEELNSKLRLNEGQARRMTVVLARLERKLLDLRATVLLPPDNSPLTIYEDPIDPALAESLNQLTAQAQAQIRRMTRDLGLQAARNPIRRAHLAAFQLLNIDLYSSHPSEGLRGYGKVAPATAAYLEAELVKLETLTSEIIRVLEHSQSD